MKMTTIYTFDFLERSNYTFALYVIPQVWHSGLYCATGTTAPQWSILSLYSREGSTLESLGAFFGWVLSESPGFLTQPTEVSLGENGCFYLPAVIRHLQPSR